MKFTNTLKLFLALIVVSTQSYTSFAQETQTELSQPNVLQSPANLSRIQLGPHGLDFSYEMKLNDQLVWENSIGAGWGAYVGQSYFLFQHTLARPTLNVKSELKYLYNFKKRQLKGKSVHNNASNYLGVQLKGFIGWKGYYYNRTVGLIDMHWGIQRNLSKRLTFNTHIGLGLAGDLKYHQFVITPTGKVAFGYVLFNSKY